MLRMTDLAYCEELEVDLDRDGDVVVTFVEGGTRTGGALTPEEALVLAEALRQVAE